MWNDALAKNAVAPLVLRLVLAVIFLYHGWDKIAGKDNDWGATWANKITDRSGYPPEDVLQRLRQYVQVEKQKRERGEGRSEPLLPDDIENRVRNAYAALLAPDVIGRAPGSGAVHLQSSVQLLVAWGELVGGVALLLGLLTRFAALGLIVIQVGAIALVTGALGFSAGGAAGWEYNLALIGMCLTLVFLGSGPWALNRLFWRWRPSAGVKPEPVAPVAATP
jgi:putative oxidoreductase